MRKSFGFLGNKNPTNEHLMDHVSSHGGDGSRHTESSDGRSQTSNSRQSLRVSVSLRGSAGPPKNQLSTFMGVVVPCLLNMFGIVLYLKIPLVAGSGYGWLLMQILMCMSVSLPTILRYASFFNCSC